jgi:transcriptional regulator with XRE-family HTH domain
MGVYKCRILVRVEGTRIREARLTAGMTQAQLARVIQTTEKNISRWESNDNEPRVSSISAIAQATGRDLDFFLIGSEEADDEEAAALPRSLATDLQQLARVAAILEKRPDLVEDILAADAEVAT